MPIDEIPKIVYQLTLMSKYIEKNTIVTDMFGFLYPRLETVASSEHEQKLRTQAQSEIILQLSYASRLDSVSLIVH